MKKRATMEDYNKLKRNFDFANEEFDKMSGLKGMFRDDINEKKRDYKLDLVEKKLILEALDDAENKAKKMMLQATRY